MKTIFAASAAAFFLVGLAAPASAGRDEAQWQRHWKSVEAQQKMQSQPRGAAVAGRPGAAAREGTPSCPGIGSAHPKRAYNC